LCAEVSARSCGAARTGTCGSQFGGRARLCIQPASSEQFFRHVLATSMMLFPLDVRGRRNADRQSSLRCRECPGPARRGSNVAQRAFRRTEMDLGIGLAWGSRDDDAVRAAIFLRAEQVLDSRVSLRWYGPTALRDKSHSAGRERPSTWGLVAHTRRDASQRAAPRGVSDRGQNLGCTAVRRLECTTEAATSVRSESTQI